MEETDEHGDLLAPENRLTVFPGLELTLAVPCQALLILDADFPPERLQTVLDVLAIEPADESASKHSDPEQLAMKDLGELHERLDENSWLRGHYIVMPNVTDGGHATLIRKGMQKHYIDMPCVGGYLDGEAGKLGTGNRKIFAGGDKKWGNKRIAVIQTSDSRTATFEDLGKSATWIKWSQPTAEALRQACLAQESRVAHEEPDLPNVAVTRLHVSNSKFMGPIELELNPQYNAFIGGRGTGKSTCLEYLRWALCDQPPTLGGVDDIPDQATRRERLITQTLQPLEGQVEVHFLLNGTPHMVRRYASTGEVMLKVGSNELLPATPEDVRSLLPIEAYSQRQLSSVGVRLEQLTLFVTTPIRDRLNEIKTRSAETAAEIRENYAHLERYRSLSKAIAKDRFTIDSLTQRAENLRGTLGGLSDEDRECLSSKPRYDEADQLVDSWIRKIEQARGETERFQSALQDMETELRVASSDNLPERPALQGLEGEIRELLTKLVTTAEAAATTLENDTQEGSRIASFLRSWRETSAAYQGSYVAATERSTAQASRLKELEGLESRQRELQRQVDTQREELAALGDPVKRHAELRKRWREIQSDGSQILEEQCAVLTDLSGGIIRASVRRGAGTARLQERFKAAVAGSGLRSAKVDAFLAEVANAEDPLAAWHAAMDELESRVLDAGESSVPTNPLTTAMRAFSEADVAKSVEKITPEQILDLGLLPLDDHPVFAYRTKEGEYISFEDASAGQQATALLRVLLKHGGPPLLIDQPEDDLDSQVILEIVDQIWAAKRQRQLIFSSHNANLVVNGDAELVACCDYRAAGDHSGGRIKLEGAIDIPEVRDEITAVMEGGERAFRLRKEKYGF